MTELNASELSQQQQIVGDSEENMLQVALNYYSTYVRPYWWLYPVGIILAVIGGMIYLRTAIPLYRSTARVHVSSSGLHLLDVRGVSDPLYGSNNARNFIRTQLMLITSKKNVDAAYKLLEEQSVHVAKCSYPTATRVVDADFIDVSVASEDADSAAKVANAVVEVYMKRAVESKISLNSTGQNLLKDQLEDIQTKRDQAVNDLLEFKKQHNIFDLEYTYRSTTGQLSTLNNKIFEMGLEIEEIDMTLQDVQENREEAAFMLPYLIPEKRVEYMSSLQTALLTHEMKLPELLQNYDKNNYIIKTHNLVTELIKKASEREVEISLEGLKLRRARTAKRIEHMKKQVAEIAEKLAELDKLAGEFKQREAVCNTMDKTIQLIANRMNEMRIVEASTRQDDYSIRKFSDAVKANTPFFPDQKRVMMMALAIGLVVSAGLSFLLVSINNKVTDISIVNKAFGNKLIVFGEVPKFDKEEKELMRSDGEESIDEVFRNIRTSLNLSMQTKDSKFLAISSSFPSEGKTFIVTQLARCFARDNKRVLLLDLDLRKPRMYKILEGFLPEDSSKRGLSNVLVGDCKLEDVVIHIDELNLDVALAGPPPPNPNELLGSTAFTKLLDDAKANYDLTLIDTPPIMPVSDTLLIAAHAYKIPLLLVAMLEELRRPVLRHLRERLERVNIRITGLIANNANSQGGGYSKYGKGYGYGYGYGYGREYRKDADKQDDKSSKA